MHLPSLLLSVLVVPAATLVTVAAPVTTTPSAAPRPVPPAVVEVPLAVEDAVAASSADGARPAGRRTVVLTEQRSTGPFSTVGVTWAPSPDTGEVQVSVRTRGARGWTGWTPLDVVASPTTAAESGPQAREGAGPAWAGRSDGVQVRVDVASGAAPRDVELVLIDPGSSPADAPAVLPASVASAQETEEPVETGEEPVDGTSREWPPVIRSRAEWGADESIRTKAPTYSRTLEAVVVHHTAGGNDYTEADVPAVLRGIYAFHVKSRGWSDIGYNVLVDKFGTAWEGRAGGLDRPVIGAHAGGFNTSTAGISMIGTYDLAPPPAVVSTVAELAAWKLGLYGREPDSRVTLTSAGGGTSRSAAGTPVEVPRIFGHRLTNSTECPGEGGNSVLGEIRAEAAARAATTEPRVQPFGAFDGVVGGAEQAIVHGWAVDPDSSEAVRVVPVVDGVAGAPAAVSVDRPDVQSSHPPYPVRSGFAVPVAAEPGEHLVCVLIQNQARGSDEQLGCHPVTVVERTPPPGPRTPDDSCPEGQVRASGFSDTSTSVHRGAIDCAVEWDTVRGRVDGTFAPALALSRGHMALVLARTLAASGETLPASPPRAFDDLGGVSAEVRLAVEQLAHLGVVKGRTARTYDPTATVTRAQMASFLVGAYEHRSGRTLAAGEDWYTDDDGSVHEAAIGKVAKAGITGGAGGTSYQPDRPTERGQTATFVVRVLDLLVEEGTAPRR